MATTQQRLAEWQLELLDLSNRNRFLNFCPATSRASSLELVQPDTHSIYSQLLDGVALKVLGTEFEETDESDNETSADNTENDNIESQRLDEILPQVSPVQEVASQFPAGVVRSELRPERVEVVLNRLAKQARASEQEQGIGILFAAFGLLRWRDPNSKDPLRSAPVLLVPIKVEQNQRDGSYRLRWAEEDPEVNLTLVEKLKRDHGLNLQIDLESSPTLAETFSTVRATVAQFSDWTLLEQVHLGLFQFHKLRMFQDLAEHAEIAAEHPLVLALAHDDRVIDDPGDVLISEDDLDRKVAPNAMFTVLDADSSQLRAIRAAASGANLVIDGPPGTGKSQTIANIIAECIAAGKTVLFVSEKAAAIEVVHRRLAEKGLGDECLMLHSQKANKREVIYELGRRLDVQLVSENRPTDDAIMNRLSETRFRLNNYAMALHATREPFGRSVFQAYGRLSQLAEMPLPHVVIPDVEHLTEERLLRWTELLERVRRHQHSIIQGTRHPWHGLAVTDISLLERERLRLSLSELRSQLIAAHEVGSHLASALAIVPPTSINNLRQVQDLVVALPGDVQLRPIWFDSAKHTEALKLAHEAKERSLKAATLQNGLLEAYDPKIVEFASPEVVETFRRGAATRFFSRRYRKNRAALRIMERSGQQRTNDEQLASLQSAIELRDQLTWFENQGSNLLELLGLLRSGDQVPSSDSIGTVSRGLESAEIIRKKSAGSGPTTDAIERLCSAEVVEAARALVPLLQQANESIERNLSILDEFFSPSALKISNRHLADNDIQLVARWAESKLSAFDSLDGYLQGRAALTAAADDGLGSLVEMLLQTIAPTQWLETFEKLLLTYWLDQVIRSDESLRQFDGEEHDALIDRFRELDRQYISIGVSRIKDQIAGRRRNLSRSAIGEPAILSREYNKKRSHLPVRRLFERIPNLVPSLAPCLMMSPLSVAHFLPADRYHFDIVIFDEASQVRPHDSVGAIMRGRQLIVAGDEHQLPPTSFFDRVASDEDEGAEDQDFLRDVESLLKAMRARGMRPVPLMWHYRSRHEDLIAFSNHNIYNNSLITFPSADSGRSPVRGVQLDLVPDALYEIERDTVTRNPIRVNRTEAKRVAHLVLEHARTRPTESLGVVALNMRQREVIKEELANLRNLDLSTDDFFSETAPEPFFVKALEQVQGDERDVIVISVGYGKDASGKLLHSFGPINQEGGYRRLNVLTTRARHQIVVVSSIRSADIDLNRAQKRGAKLLKEYLDFAERGQVALQAVTTGGDGEYDSPFEEEVGMALERAGFTVRRQVGCSKFRIDLAVVDPHMPGRYALGIECDGASYHSSKTARDRDRLRQEILEGLGWQIHRVWSTDWIRSPERDLDDVIRAINEAISGKSRQVRRATKQTPSAEESQIMQLAPPISPAVRVTAIAQPYVEAELSGNYHTEILSTPVQHIVDLVVGCVSVEGPVHVDLVKRRVASVWGYSKLGSRIDATISNAIDSAARRELISRRGLFLWRKGESNSVLRGPTADGVTRDIGHIPGEEILLAFAEVLKTSLSLSQDELITQTARVFGYRRTGSDISRRLAAMLQLAEANDLIVQRNGRFQLTS